MSNKNELIKYCEKLTSTLNENGFFEKFKMDGEYHQFKYEVDIDCPECTINSITNDIKAYSFLLKQGLIDQTICHFCGEKPIDSTFTFKEPQNGITLNICENCHSRGRREQETFKNSIKPQGGCLLMLSAIIAFFILLALIF